MRIIIDLREIIIGAIIGIIIIVGICGVIYGPDYIREISYPAKQKVKFISVNQYSLRDWVLRLDDESEAQLHKGQFRTPFLSAPFTLKEIRIEDVENGKRIFGQFETLTENIDLLGKFEITQNGDSPLSIDVGLLSAKINYEALSFNRLSGNINLKEGKTGGSIEGTIQAGSMSYSGLSFGGMQLRLIGNSKSVAAEIKTHISGHNTSSLNAFAKIENETIGVLNGTFSTDSLTDSIRTLQIMAMGEERPLPNFLLENFNETEIKFTETTAKNMLGKEKRFDLSIPTLGDTFEGLAALNLQEKTLELGARINNIWPRVFPYGLEKSSGTITSKGVVKLSFNQKNDDSMGPFSTRIDNVTLKKNAFEITNINGAIRHTKFNPMEIEVSPLTASRMLLQNEALETLEINLDLFDNELNINSVAAEWMGRKTNLSLDLKEGNGLPDISVKSEFKSLASITDILRFDMLFSAPIALTKSWRFKEGGYEADPTIIRNTETGILTLNENVPELSNILARDLLISLDSPERATLKVKGTNPLLYGSAPVELETEIERLLAE